MHCKLITLALGGLMAIGVTATAFAQDPPPPPPDQNQAGPPAGQSQGGRGMRMNPDQQLARLTAALDLTADQQAKIKPLLVDRQQKIQALMQDQSGVAPEDRRTQMRSISEGTNTSIKALLTDDQKQKFDAMQANMRRNGPGGGGPGGPPPPPPDSSSPQPQN